MKINGLVKNIDVDGYERLLTIQTDDQTFWCNHVQPNEYLEPGQPSKYLEINAHVNFATILNFVGQYDLTEGRSGRGMIQDVAGFPHSVAIGEVVEKIAPDIYLLSIGEVDQIEVHFETDVELNISDYIRVEGELTVEDNVEI